MCEQISKECAEFAPALQTFNATKTKIERMTEGVKTKVVEIKDQVNHVKKKLAEAEQEMQGYKKRYK